MKVTDSPLIHIGFAKCASTSLQQCFFLSCNEFSYLGIGMKICNKSIDAYNALFSIATLSRCDYEEQKEAISHKIYSFLDEKSSVVISNEILSSSNYTPFQNQTWCDILTVGERLYGLFQNAKILVIIRNQLSVLPSIYSEISKPSNVSVKWDDYIDIAIKSAEKGRGSVLHRLNYYHIVKVYSDLFGKENIKIVLMEELIKDPKKIFQEISNLCGYHNIVSSDYCLKKENSRVTRWDKCKQKLRPMFYKPFIESLKKGNIIKNIDKELGSILDTPSYGFSEKQAHYLENYYKKANKMLSDETGIDLKAAGYPFP